MSLCKRRCRSQQKLVRNAWEQVKLLCTLMAHSICSKYSAASGISSLLRRRDSQTDTTASSFFPASSNNLLGNLAHSRLCVIRVVLVRLSQTLELFFHASSICPVGPEVEAFFGELVKNAAKMQLEGSIGRPMWSMGVSCDRNLNDKTQDDPRDIAQPTFLFWLKNTVEELFGGCEALLQLLCAPKGAVKGSVDENVSSKQAVVPYPGLMRRIVRQVGLELRTLRETFLYSPSTPSLSTNLHAAFSFRALRERLTDSIAFHLRDYNKLLTSRLRWLTSELTAEGASFSAPVRRSAGSNAFEGMVSIIVLDVAVGVISRHPSIVLAAVKAKILKLQRRIATAEAASLVDKSEGAAPWLLPHRRELQVMANTCATGAAEVDELQSKWKEVEQSILNRLDSSTDFSALSATKALRASEVMEEALRWHDRIVTACLPFAVPQYDRRFQLSYAEPCMVRIGIRVFDAAQGRARVFTHSCAELAARRLCCSIDLEDTLAPSQFHFWLSFDDFPVMVGSDLCALRAQSRTKAELERCLEEHREIGGYFILHGSERILRALLLQRCNVPLNITRPRFASQGPFSSRAVIIRCKRRSGLTIQNYFFYSITGNVTISFARKLVWQLPVMLLIGACNIHHHSHSSIYAALTTGHPCNDTEEKEFGAAKTTFSFLSGAHLAKVEAILQHHLNQPYGSLQHHLDLLAVLGRLFLQNGQRSFSSFRFLPDTSGEIQTHADAWYGLFLLRRHVLPHLNTEAPTPELLPQSPSQDSCTDPWPGELIRKELDRKYNALLLIIRQLLAYVGIGSQGSGGAIGGDKPSDQEVHTSSCILVAAFEVALTRTLRPMAFRLASGLNGSVIHALLGSMEGVESAADASAPAESVAEKRQKCASALSQIARHLESSIPTITRRNRFPLTASPLQVVHRLLSSGTFILDRDEDFFTPQTTGWVVSAEHLNYMRFFEQLRCLHRGKTIAELRSSEIRRFPAEGYGFICIVHSPDGEDCGVLNHLTLGTIISDQPTIKQETRLLNLIEDVLQPSVRTTKTHTLQECFMGTVPVFFEGRLLGYLLESDAAAAATALRQKKTITSVKGGGVELLAGAFELPRRLIHPLHTLEVIHVPQGCSTSPGLYLFAWSGRLARPVASLLYNPSSKDGVSAEELEKAASIETDELPFSLTYIGTWEQTWLDIASVPSDLGDAWKQQRKTYGWMELDGSHLLSVTASTIPLFEYNCSPRNLFQCGLSKQSVGVQLQAQRWRKEAKLFRMYTPQRFLIRTLPMETFALDDMAIGVNAVVAVLCYTGYDMDDAVIINQTSASRGMLDAGITTAKVIQAGGKGSMAASSSTTSTASPEYTAVFHNWTSEHRKHCDALDERGLPHERVRDPSVWASRDHRHPQIVDDTPLYCTARRFLRPSASADPNAVAYEYTHHHLVRWRHLDRGEWAYLHHVVPLTYDGPDPTSILLVFRTPRPQDVGDKFSSRHGQKGTLPLHIAATDLPFSADTGVIPDVVINPHAFPSRMTVGMLMELLVGKFAAMEGRFMDHSAWSATARTVLPRSDDPPGSTLGALQPSLEMKGSVSTQRRKDKEAMWREGVGGVKKFLGFVKEAEGVDASRQVSGDSGRRREKVSSHADAASSVLLASMSHGGVARVVGAALAHRHGLRREGRERMICGVTGEPIEAEVFVGVAGYQRLRHMVRDKWQSRARTDAFTHRAVTTTGQPVQGRKRHGGVRVGEMERDGLLSHGAAEVVVDRLMHVSDGTKVFICTDCGSFISTYERHTTPFSSWKTCRYCGAGQHEETDAIRLMDVPQVFRLWATELGSIGVRVTLATR